jgi:excisionase family DNA binding protein
MYNLSQTAAVLDVSETSILDMIRDGELRALPVGDVWLVDGHSLHGYVRECCRRMLEAAEPEHEDLLTPGSTRGGTGAGSCPPV